MYPFYFGPSEAPLFGVYHQPAAGTPGNRAVVLCYPLGHEYVRVHRAFRNLAVELSQHGWHVLRFDYYGAGDSAGEADETTICRCAEGVDEAIDELKDMSGAARVSLLGLRIGATLAAGAAARRADVDRLIAWDPVPAGAEYLNELQQLHERWLRLRPWTRTGDDRSREIIGFPLPVQLEEELRRLDVASLSPCRALRTCLVLSDADTNGRETRWRQAVNADPARDTCVHVTGMPSHWGEPEHVHRSLLAREAVQAIVAAMVEP